PRHAHGDRVCAVDVQQRAHAALHRGRGADQRGDRRVTQSTTQTLELGDTVRRLLQRQIMPVDGDVETLPLYVDPEPAILDADKYEVGSNRNAKAINAVSMRQKVGNNARLHPDQIVDRHAFRVPSGESLSFGTYFNAFPAAYWRRWTVVDRVRLTVTVEGA